jgi:hypothetical protein
VALLSTLVRQPELTPHNKFDRKTGTQYYAYQFCTMSLPCLNIYREWFYPEGVKIVPNDIAQHLTARGVAHWFMQDGSKTTDNGVTFATHCFSKQNYNFSFKPCLLNLVLIVLYKIWVEKVTKRLFMFVVLLSLVS